MNFIGTIDYIKDDTMLIKLDRHSKNKLKDIKTDKEYLFKIESMKEKRTLQQNRYIWEIISQIDKKVNGYMSDEMTIYKQIIEKAKIKTLYIQTIEDAKKDLEQAFRFVEEVEKRESKKGVTTVLYRCYWGTSKFDKKEMADFIECLIDRAYQEGIDVYGYEELLKGVKSGNKTNV